MQTLKAVLREVTGLFVDDGSLAFAVIVWIGIVWLMFKRFHVPFPGGNVLMIGFCAVLIGNLIQSTRRISRKPKDRFRSGA